MNFLAHVHLSGKNTDLMVGNFIADAVKGNASLKYSGDILKGIMLHRQIDTFTDAHGLHKQSRSLIRSDFGKFSGIVVDIYYDHFLAKNWQTYSDEPLSNFTSRVYKELSKRLFIVPNHTRRILPFMISQNWLLNYANFKGLENVFHGMDRRTKYISGMQNGVEVLKKNYKLLNDDFNGFYPELIHYVDKQKKAAPKRSSQP